jgi:ABC-type nitrate/sulfonate/bicarbonate transport system permease component
LTAQEPAPAYRADAPPAATARGPAGRRGLRALIAAVDPMRLVGVVALIAVWQALATAMPAALLPPPGAVAARVGSDFFSAPELSFYGLTDASLFGSMLYTAANVAIALVIGAAIGIVAGLASARFGFVRAVIDPIMLTAGTIPILVAAPFLLIWFGVGRASAVALVAFYVVVILYLFAQRAADNLDPVYEESARTLGATRRRMLADILLPGTVPEILGGIRIALAGAWGLEAIAELLGSQQGMGKIIEVLAGGTDAEGIMAALLVLGLVAMGADALAAASIARLAAWSAAAQPGEG